MDLSSLPEPTQSAVEPSDTMQRVANALHMAGVDPHTVEWPEVTKRLVEQLEANATACAGASSDSIRASYQYEMAHILLHLAAVPTDDPDALPSNAEADHSDSTKS